jgi:hypothetical protein
MHDRGAHAVARTSTPRRRSLEPRAAARLPLAACRRAPHRRGMNRLRRAAAAAAMPSLLAGCAFHSTATHWNGRVGADGRPIYVKATTNVGLNVFVLLPLLGNTTIDAMLDETSSEIAESGSDRLRVVQTASENYWYGLPPITWLLTPVVTDVSVEYEPSAAEQAEAAAADRRLAERAAARTDEEKARVIPEPRRR